MSFRFFLLALALLLLIPAGCSESGQERTVMSGSGALMTFVPGGEWIGRVQRASGGPPGFDTLRVDSTMRIDTLEWFHLAERSGTGAPRPDWIEGAWVTPRPDGIHTPRLHSTPVPGTTLLRRMAWPVATGDTAVDFGWFEELTPEGTAGEQSHEIGVVAAVDEEVEVPAGHFSTYRVEMRRANASGGSPTPHRSMYSILWFAPGAGLVRAEAHGDSGSVDQVWELVKMMQGRGGM